MYIVHCLKKILSDILMYSTREHCPSYIFSFFYSINVQKLSLCLTFKHNFASELVQNQNDGNEEAEDELVETQYVPLMTKSIMVRDKCDKLETVEESSVNFDDSPDRDSSYYLIRDLPDFTETD